MSGGKVEIDDIDSFIERTADAVVKRIDEREKIVNVRPHVHHPWSGHVHHLKCS